MKNDKNKILVVEDEVGVRKNIVEYLRLQNYDVYEAADGLEAYALVTSVTPDLIITDINMPKMDGLALVEKVRKEDTNVAIIIISAHSDTEKLLRAVKLNLTEYIIKPIERKMLKSLIKKVFSEKREVVDSSVVTLEDGYFFDTKMKVLYHNKKRIDLTPHQGLLLDILVRYKNSVVSSVDIFFHVQGSLSLEYSSAMVRNLVKNMRKVLRNDSIQNVYGSGYMLVVPDLEDIDLSLYDELMEGIVLLNDEGCVLSCNRVMLELFGYEKREELLEVKIGRLIPECGSDVLRSCYEKKEELEMECIRKDDTSFLGKVVIRKSKIKTKSYNMVMVMDLTKTIERYAVDNLTKLPTRSVLQNEFKKLQINHKYRQEAASAIFVDIDDFKYINDTLGHQEGDRIIKNVADILQESVRKDDIVIRWGGDEFLILLFNTPLHAAMNIAENIRQNITSLHLQCCKHMTCSFGVDTLHFDDTLDTLISRIDIALIHAKDSRKDCVVSYSKISSFT